MQAEAEQVPECEDALMPAMRRCVFMRWCGPNFNRFRRQWMRHDEPRQPDCGQHRARTRERASRYVRAGRHGLASEPPNSTLEDIDALEGNKRLERNDTSRPKRT